jgi:response regulator RpfG family c-di-GMP phosphodiesterase
MRLADQIHERRNKMHNVLMVDDDKNILNGYKRNLHGIFNVITAESGAEAIDRLNGSSDNFHVILSDYKMPVMNGVEFLDKAKELSPNSILMMLTGQADMDAIIVLINKGNIFRFLTKPCSSDDLVKNLNDAVRQYELVSSEKDLLGKTLGGSIKVLTDLLMLAKPQASQRALRLRGYIKRILPAIKYEQSWQIEIGAMLSQIGCVTIPDDILKKVFGGRMLTEYELQMFQDHPNVAAEMLQNIPRMEPVAMIIKYQEKFFNGNGVPADDVMGENIPLGARVLKIIMDYDALINAGHEAAEAVKIMNKRDGVYDSVLFENISYHLMKNDNRKKNYINKEVSVNQLSEDMYLAEDVLSASGAILGNKNQKMTKALIITFMNYLKNEQLKDTLKVFILTD